ncbi:MAG: deoxyribonuclease V [Gammaproteobacteria bacterium]|jgi:deoxyribonuclease V
MHIHHRHRWDVTPAEAIAVQRRLSGEVIAVDRFSRIDTVAGVDVGFEEQGTVTRAAVAVLSFPDLKPQEYAVARRPTVFPYIPGLLSFREVPAVLDALRRLRRLPDMLLCDGQGQAHPRRFGIACHLGVLTDLPAIGVAKSRLVGSHAPLAEDKGARQALYDKDEVIGMVLRTRHGIRPLYISVGHRIALDTAVEYVLRCITRYRLPETTRAAHKLASGPA